MEIKSYMQKLSNYDKEFIDRLPDWVKELKNIWEEANVR